MKVTHIPDMVSGCSPSPGCFSPEGHLVPSCLTQSSIHTDVPLLLWLLSISYVAAFPCMIIHSVTRYGVPPTLECSVHGVGVGFSVGLIALSPALKYYPAHSENLRNIVKGMALVPRGTEHIPSLSARGPQKVDTETQACGGVSSRGRKGEGAHTDVVLRFLLRWSPSCCTQGGPK